MSAEEQNKNPHRLPWTVVSVEHSAWVRECDGKDVVFTSTRDAKKIVDAANAMPPGLVTAAASKELKKKLTDLENDCSDLRGESAAFRSIAEKLEAKLKESERKREAADKELTKIKQSVTALLDDLENERKAAGKLMNLAAARILALEEIENVFSKEGGSEEPGEVDREGRSREGVMRDLSAAIKGWPITEGGSQ